MARFYANENFPFPVVVRLRALGHEVSTTNDEGTSNQRIADEEVLAFAVARGRAVLTLNRRDFIRLHNKCDAHLGIVVCHWRRDEGLLSRLIDDAVKDGPLTGKLVRL